MTCERNKEEDRNRRITKVMERIGNEAALLLAKTERLRMLKDHYEAYLNRVYPIKKNYLIEMYDIKSHYPELIYVDEPLYSIDDYLPQFKAVGRSYFEGNTSTLSSVLDNKSTRASQSGKNYLPDVLTSPENLFTSESLKNRGGELVNMNSFISDERNEKCYASDLIAPILTTIPDSKFDSHYKSSRKESTLCDNCERLKRQQMQSYSYNTGPGSYGKSNYTYSDFSRFRFRNLARNSKIPMSRFHYQSFPNIEPRHQRVRSDSVAMRTPLQRDTYIDNIIKSKLENSKRIIDRYSRLSQSWNGIKNKSQEDADVRTYLKKREVDRLASYSNNLIRHSIPNQSFTTGNYSAVDSKHNYQKILRTLSDRETVSHRANLYKHVVFSSEVPSSYDDVLHKNSSTSLLQERGRVQNYNIYPSNLSTLSSYPSNRSSSVSDTQTSSGQRRSYLSSPFNESDFQKVPFYQRDMSTTFKGDIEKSPVKIYEDTKHDRDEVRTNMSGNTNDGSLGRGHVDENSSQAVAEKMVTPRVVIFEADTEEITLIPQIGNPTIETEKVKSNIITETAIKKKDEDNDNSTHIINQDENNNENNHKGKKSKDKQYEENTPRQMCIDDLTNSELKRNSHERESRATEKLKQGAIEEEKTGTVEESFDRENETRNRKTVEDEKRKAASDTTLKVEEEDKTLEADTELKHTDAVCQKKELKDIDGDSRKTSTESPPIVKSEVVTNEGPSADGGENELNFSDVQNSTRIKRTSYTDEDSELMGKNQKDTDMNGSAQQVDFGAIHQADVINDHSEKLAFPQYDGVHQEVDGHLERPYEMFQHQTYTDQEQQPLDEQNARQYENQPQHRYEEQPQLPYEEHQPQNRVQKQTYAENPEYENQPQQRYEEQPQLSYEEHQRQKRAQKQKYEEDPEYENQPQQRYEEQQLSYEGLKQQSKVPNQQVYEENPPQPFEVQEQPPYESQGQPLYDEHVQQQYLEQQEPYNEIVYDGSSTQYRDESHYVEQNENYPQDPSQYPKFENTREDVYDENQIYEHSHAQDEFRQYDGHGSQELLAPEPIYGQDGRVEYSSYQNEYPVNNENYGTAQQLEEYAPGTEGEDYSQRIPEEYGRGYENQHITSGEYEQPRNMYGEANDPSPYVHHTEEYGQDGYQDQEYRTNQGDLFEPEAEYPTPEYHQDLHYSDEPQKYTDGVPEQYQREELTHNTHPYSQDARRTDYSSQQEVSRQGNTQYEEMKVSRAQVDAYQEPHRKATKE
ncbi:unnamed protein product [Bemisia tabaci]|uniref:Uncharacterized protein n=1 Tax=Bemisia tabaci TaxID=7038 RepID=A0A9P0A7Z1_BEMTA|nr:unnamed protein product [Bemisia tabaci]